MYNIDIPRTLLLLIIGLTTLVGIPHDARAKEINFARDIQPIFAKRCYECHGPRKQESSFRLDVKSIAMRGGDLGERSIVPGKSDKSFLIRAVSDPGADIKMPPKGQRLSAVEVSLLKRWIEQGAIWPDQLSGDATITTDHWSFQPLSRDPLPPETNDSWTKNPIDAFILAKLKQNGLLPSPIANRSTLIRRVYLDMLGLRPSPDEVQQFLNDEHPLAFERLVDRVLASPRYGERWARHWLDVVRFAESHGFETNRERPSAWPYRDYVIGALNGDKPYDQFVKQQIAGDAMGADEATGFLVAGPYDLVKSPDVNLTLMQRQDELADIVNTTGTTFLGLTLGCARCHNHKFDPILQRDYYSLQAVFAGVIHGERSLSTARTAEQMKQERGLKERLAAAKKEMSNLLSQLKLRPQVNAKENVEQFPVVKAKWIRFTILATNTPSQPCIDEFEIFSVVTDKSPPRNIALATAGARAASSSNLPGYEIHQLKHINDGHYGNSHSWISNEQGGGWIQIELAEPAAINRIVWARDRQMKYKDRLATRYRIEIATEPEKWAVVASSDDRLPPAATPELALAARLDKLPVARQTQAKSLINELKTLEQQIKQFAPAATAYVGQFKQPGPTHRLYRGDPLAKREVVPPDALSVTGSLGLDMNTPEQKRRIALANWIADAKNPLTARVIVNRLWHYHFGTGIVSTPSDFGANGARPTHSKLLDWLANELMATPNRKSAIKNHKSPWSLKRIHRLILTSNTYRQSSLPRADCLAKDADTQLLWRFPPRRLEAEAIRDSILAVSGALDLRMGGPGFNVFDVQMENVRHYFPKEKFGPAEWRRMVYVTKYRQEQDATFGAFDCPDGSQTMPRRPVSTSPLQAFNLLNSNFVLDQAKLFAHRLKRIADDDVYLQVNRAFQLTCNRKPDDSERAAAVQLVSDHGLTALCRALLNSNEFLFVQ